MTFKKLGIVALALALALSALGAAAESTFNAEGYPISNELITVTAAGPFGLQVEYEEILTWQEWQDRLGIKLEMNFYNYEDWPTQFTLMIASDSLPDIIFSSGLSAADCAEYGSQGYFVNLLDYEELIPNVKQAWEDYPGLQAAMTSYDGGVYGTKAIVTSVVNKIPRVFINKVWLENVGKEIPTTIDELYDVLVAFKEMDANGNGDPNDEIPMGYYTNSTAQTEKALLAAFGFITDSTEYILQADEENNIYIAETTEPYRAYLRFMHQCYEEGLMDSEAFTLTNAEVMQNCANDRYGFYGTGSAPYVMATADMSYDANWAGVMGLTSEYNDTPTLGIPSGIQSGFQMHINAASEYVEELVRFVDYLYTEEGGTSTFSGYEGVTFDYEMDDLLGIEVLTIYCPEGYSSSDEFRQYKAVFNGPFLTYSGIPVRDAIWYDVSEETLKNPDVVNKYGWIANLALASRAEGLQHVSTFPSEAMSYTQEELEVLTALKTDITNYLQQAKASFIIGEWDLDTDWDTFIEQLNAMGLDQLLAIEQASWDRFNAA